MTPDLWLTAAALVIVIALATYAASLLQKGTFKKSVEALGLKVAGTEKAMGIYRKFSVELFSRYRYPSAHSSRLICRVRLCEPATGGPLSEASRAAIAQFLESHHHGCFLRGDSLEFEIGMSPAGPLPRHIDKLVPESVNEAWLIVKSATGHDLWG